MAGEGGVGLGPDEPSNAEPKDVEITKPLKILELKKDSSEVEILTENLERIGEILRATGASLVSIVAVMGTYRTGKSFLLDLMMRYLKSKQVQEKTKSAGTPAVNGHAMNGHSAEAPPEETHAAGEAATSVWRVGTDQKQSPPGWILEGNARCIAEGSRLDETSAGFAWRPGKDKCTQGIWLWSAPFVFEKDGRKVAVLLMDTQGAWDDTMSKAQSATIFGLTALLSSKLIYNIQNRVEEDKLENLDYITTFAQTVCSQLPGKDAPFGHLELLVRDWANYEDGFTESQCKEQMEEHLDDHMSDQKVPEDARPRVNRLKTTFRSIRCFGLPHPGLKVTKPTYAGEIEAIDKDFLHLLDHFAEDFFGGDFPLPSAPLGHHITVDLFTKIVVNFADAFRESAQGLATGLREAFVNLEKMKSRDELLNKFREAMARIAPETAVLDPVELEKKTAELKSEYAKTFSTKLAPWRIPDAEAVAAKDEFMQRLSEMIYERTSQNEQQVEGATAKLLATPVVGCAAYFVLAHTFILVALGAVGTYFYAKTKSEKLGVDMRSPEVTVGMYEDCKKFFIQRKKDVQAMQVAMKSCTPHQAMESLMHATSKISTAAAAATATTSVAAHSSGTQSNSPPASSYTKVSSARP